MQHNSPLWTEATTKEERKDTGAPETSTKRNFNEDKELPGMQKNCMILTELNRT